jgi:hypothetical protein
MLLTNMLPNQGNDSFTLHAFAVDREGNRIKLGQKTITGDNAGSVKPFGTIDTPQQGETISGDAFLNFGWALTPQPNMIPIDGSTIWVFVNSLPLGRPSYNHNRDDIAMLFPDLRNSDGAVGLFYLDTTALTNGCHTIAWGVTDSAGNSEGLGSRYFNVLNLGSGGEISAMGEGSVEGPSRPRRNFANSGQRPPTFGEVWSLPPCFDILSVKRGYSERAETQAERPDHLGVARLSMREVDRIEIAIDPRNADDKSNSAVYSGFLVVNEELRPLPIGSTLDPRSGVFSWQPGPGFLGEYTLVFLRERAGGVRNRSVVKITIEPKF